MCKDFERSIMLLIHQFDKLEGKHWLNISNPRCYSTYEITANPTFKISEYSFKQNKIMLKDVTVLLYTYFCNISLNVLSPTFFNTYNLPFLCSPNIGKILAKVGPKTNCFFFILSSCTNKIAVSNNFFHWYVANQEANKIMPTTFFFPNIFWIIYF